MTSIPVAISRFSDNNFKRFYLKKERLFVYFLFHFWNVPDNNFQRLYLKKQTHFVDFGLHFWNVHEI